MSEFQLGIGKQFNWLTRTGYPLATNCQLTIQIILFTAKVKLIHSDEFCHGSSHQLQSALHERSMHVSVALV